MAYDDIGYMIFQQLLGMSQYPGDPFTGNLFKDLIMFFIIPTIFIILVIYTMTGRIVADSKIRIMLGLGAYLFIIAGGYYSAFALLSGPYFIFLIFIMGLLYFLMGHFKGPQGGGGGGTHQAGPGGGFPMEGSGGRSYKEKIIKYPEWRPGKSSAGRSELRGQLISIAAVENKTDRPAETAQIVHMANMLSNDVLGHDLNKNTFHAMGVKPPKWWDDRVAA